MPTRVLRTGGLKFDGVNDYVDCGNSESLNFGDSGSYSIGFWIKKTGYYKAYDEVLSKGVTGNQRIHFLVVGSIIRWSDFVGPTVPLDEWVHIFYTYSALGVNYGTEKFFKNGVETDSRTGTMPSWSDTYNYWIGYHSHMGGSWPFQGLIGEVRIYNRALSAQEISDIYNYGAVIKDGLVLLLDFTEYEGATAYDKSGLGNHGTIYGAEWVIKRAARVLAV
jgi:hypothetical protein